MANTKITAANIDSTSTGFTLADLTVDKGATGDIAHFEGQGSVHLKIGEDSNTMYLNANNGTAEIAFQSNAVEKMRLDSAGNLGIGRTDPQTKLHIEVADNTEFLRATITGNESWAFKGASVAGTSTDTVSFGIAGGTQCMTWQENGYVGIGTQTPATALEVNNFSAGDTVATFEGSYGSGGDVQLVRYERSGGAVYGAISYKDASTDIEFGNISSHNLSFTTGNTRRMTIMTNGGVEIGDGTNYGYVKVINDSAVVQYLDRRGTDGAVLEIRHADAKDGQINTLSGRMAVGSDDTGIFFDSTRDCISPFTMTGNDGRGDLIDIGRTGVKFKDIHLSGDVYFGDKLHFNAASDSSFIGSSSTVSIKYAADGEHIFQTYNGGWGTVFQVQDTGVYLQEGNYAYHNEVPEFSQHSVTSYSSSTNVTYNESTSNVPDKGEKLVAVSHARAYTNYIHFKTNLSANNIMHYFRTRGYFYGSGMEEKVHGAYTYNNTVISLEHQSVYGGTHTLTVYKSSDGYLVLRIHVNQTGYTEGKVYVYFSAHSHQVTRELEITSVIQRDDGNNAF